VMTIEDFDFNSVDQSHLFSNELYLFSIQKLLSKNLEYRTVTALKGRSGK